ncbi:MAG: hypothetical protein HYR63_27835 [Proteobacteria bacterium]|nr:hypothetical protein [Pseudomonadota bacterium]MBI3497900.1 hypothetical protein [Pseudomonadota bacterium]
MAKPIKKPPHAPTPSRPSGIQRLRTHIPTMTDAELVTLRENAERLAKPVENANAEKDKQVATAWEVISLVDVEVGNRKHQKPPAPARRSAKSPAP